MYFMGFVKQNFICDNKIFSMTYRSMKIFIKEINRKERDRWIIIEFQYMMRIKISMNIRGKINNFI